MVERNAEHSNYFSQQQFDVKPAHFNYTPLSDFFT